MGSHSASSSEVDSILSNAKRRKSGSGKQTPQKKRSAIQRAVDALAKVGQGGKRPLRKVGGFEIVSKIGSGAMGTVFKARQVSMDREVALKVLPPSIAKNERYIERFQSEARASAALNHANIVQGIDVGKDDDTGLWYFAMEYIDGPTLGQIIKKEKTIAEERVLRIGRDVAKALECAEQNKIVHRDIKPDNIILNSDNVPKLADLGLAKRRINVVEDGNRTKAGRAIGTPHYMSPEQARGENEELDIRADIYSLGATLFHCLTGQTPFKGNSAVHIMSMHLSEKVPLAHRVNTEVSEKTSRLIAKMMEKEPAKRFASASELVTRFEKLLGEGITTGPRRPIRGAGTTGPRAPIPGTTGPRRPIGVPTTGNQEPVKGMSGKAPEVMAKPRAGVGLLVGGACGVAAMVLLAVALLWGGKSRTAPAAKKTDASESVPEVKQVVATSEPDDDALTTQWKELKAFEKEHASDFPALIERYEKLTSDIRTSASDSALRESVDRGFTALRARRDAAIQSAWSELDKQIQEHVKRHDYDAAIRVCSTPQTFRKSLGPKLWEREKALRIAADARLNKILKTGEDLLKAEDHKSALDQWKKEAAITYAPGSERLAAMQRQLEAAAAPPAEKAPATAPAEPAAPAAVETKASKPEKATITELPEAFYAEFDARLRAGEFSAARALVTEALRKPDLTGAKLPLEATGHVAELLVQRRELIRKTLAARKGKRLDVATKRGNRGGILRAVEEHGLKLVAQIKINGRVKGESVFRIAWTEMQANQADRFAVGWPDVAALKARESDAAAARLWLALERSDLASADAVWSVASEHPFGAFMGTRLESARRGKAESDAKADWARIERSYVPASLTPASVGKLDAEVDAFYQRHGLSLFAAQLQTSGNQLLTRLRALRMPTEALVAYWSFNEGKGPKAIDRAPGGVESPLMGAAWSAGRIRSGLRFSGRNTHVQVADRPELNPETALTISVWLRAHSWAGGNRRIVQKGGDNNQYRLSSEGNLLRFEINGVGHVTSKLPARGAWHHVAAVYDSKALVLYVDGREAGRQAAQGAIPKSESPLYIGTRSHLAPETESFVGLLDEIRIYARALSATEIRVLLFSP